jgi:hypothetical protein
MSKLTYTVETTSARRSINVLSLEAEVSNEMGITVDAFDRSDIIGATDSMQVEITIGSDAKVTVSENYDDTEFPHGITMVFSNGAAGSTQVTIPVAMVDQLATAFSQIAFDQAIRADEIRGEVV